LLWILPAKKKQQKNYLFSFSPFSYLNLVKTSATVLFDSSTTTHSHQTTLTTQTLKVSHLGFSGGIYRGVREDKVFLVFILFFFII
jgi:hypothetical protein